MLSDKDTVPNARLLDPNVLSPTFTQQQQLKNWYGFPDQLSVDRYTIDGKTQDYVVAARELNAAGLAGQQTDWIQRHMVYTHGDGFVAAPANTVVDGYPDYTVSDVSNVAGQDQGRPAADLLRAADHRLRHRRQRRQHPGPRAGDQRRLLHLLRHGRRTRWATCSSGWCSPPATAR